jgi:pyruvate-formate lyase-activating enzyme
VNVAVDGIDARGAALAEAEAAGVLPVTSACNLSCVFCSNRANPPGVRVHHLPPRPLPDIRAALSRMGHLEEVVIGESASRVSEGEPLTHPRFEAVLAAVRERLPRALVKVTTNGTLLDRRMAALFKDCRPLEVTLSLNTCSPEGYRKVHGLGHGPGCDPLAAVRALSEAGVPFHASVVPVPALTGPGDLLETARRLDEARCLSLRVLVPAHTSFSDPGLVRLLPSQGEVVRLAEEARQAVRLPVTLEPPHVADLRARLAGVMRGTPAAAAGLRAGDVLEEVEGHRPFSRVDAFRRLTVALRRTGSCRVRVAGRGEVTLRAGDPAARPGVVLDRDVDPRDIRLVLRTAVRLRARRVLVLTSALGAGPLEMGFRAAAGTGPAVRVVPVASRSFGGSIAAAGLLTVSDFACALEPLVRDRAVQGGDLVFLPPVSFGADGLDLFGRRPGDLQALLPRGTRLIVPGLTF